jgi:excisionase family DNA binding protein
MVLTTEQAAAVLGIKTTTLRDWVARGKIEPVQRGTRPLRFRHIDVEAALVEHRPLAWHQAMDDTRTRWEAECLRLGL